MLLLLANMSAADTIFASSFLLAQATGTIDYGVRDPFCNAAGAIHEAAAICVAALTAVFAHHVHDSIVGNQQLSERTMHSELILAWLMPCVLEALLIIFVYLPHRAFVYEGARLPWCHWNDDFLGFSCFQYGCIVAAMAYCLQVYLSCYGHARRSLPRSLSKYLGFRLTSYFLAFWLSQAPAVAHRGFQVSQMACRVYHFNPDQCLQAPHHWLAALQAATQPLQGLMNACVYVHHAMPFMTSWLVDPCMPSVGYSEDDGEATSQIESMTKGLMMTALPPCGVQLRSTRYVGMSAVNEQRQDAIGRALRRDPEMFKLDGGDHHDVALRAPAGLPAGSPASIALAGVEPPLREQLSLTPSASRRGAGSWATRLAADAAVAWERAAQSNQVLQERGRARAEPTHQQESSWQSSLQSSWLGSWFGIIKSGSEECTSGDDFSAPGSCSSVRSTTSGTCRAADSAYNPPMFHAICVPSCDTHLRP